MSVLPATAAVRRVARVTRAGAAVPQALAALSAATLGVRRLGWPAPLGVLHDRLATLRADVALGALAPAAQRVEIRADTATAAGGALRGGVAPGRAGVVPSAPPERGARHRPAPGTAAATPLPAPPPRPDGGPTSGRGARRIAAMAGVPAPRYVAAAAPGAADGQESASSHRGAPSEANHEHAAEARAGLRADVARDAAPWPPPELLPPSTRAARTASATKTPGAHRPAMPVAPTADDHDRTAPAGRRALDDLVRRWESPSPTTDERSDAPVHDLRPLPRPRPSPVPATRPEAAAAAGTTTTSAVGPVDLGALESALDELLRRDAEQHGLNRGSW